MHAMIIFWVLFAVGAFLSEPIIVLKLVLILVGIVILRMLW